MKKRVVAYLCTLLLSVSGVLAKHTVSVSDVAGHPGDEVSVALSLTNDAGIVAAEFKIPLDENLTYVENSLEVSNERLDGHSVKCSESMGVLKIYVFSSLLKDLTASSGTFLTFKLKLGKEPGVYPLMPEVKLSDKEGEALPVEVSGGTATVLGARIAYSTHDIDFGRIAIRGNYAQPLQLTNTGTEALEVSAVTFSDDLFSLSEPLTTIAAGGQKTVEVICNPTQRGERKATMQVSSNACNDGEVINIAAVPFSVNELHVNSLSCFSGSEVTIVLSMNNMEAISVVQCTFALPEEVQYVKGSLSASARATGFTTIESYTDGVLKLYLYTTTDDTSITEGSGEIVSFRVKVSGVSGTYALNPESVVLGNYDLENMLSDVKGGTITLRSPALSCNTTVDMGGIAVTESPVYDFALINTGTAKLTVNRIEFEDDDFDIDETFPLYVAAGKTANVRLTRRTVEVGSFTSAMRIYSDDPVAPLKDVALSGRFYEPNELFMLKAVSQDRCTLSVGLENYSEVSAIQMVISGFEEMTASKDDVTLSDRCASMSPIVTKREDGSFMLALYSLDNATIMGHAGMLFDVVFVKAAADAQVGDVKLSEILVGNSEGVNVSSAAQVTKTRQMVNLTLSKAGEVVDHTRVVLNNERKLGFETACDAQKLAPQQLNEQTCYFYTTDAEGVRYSINERPLADGVVPISVVAYSAQTLSIAAEKMDCSMVLYDKQSGVKHALADGPYTFSVTAGVCEERFELQMPRYATLRGDVNQDGVLSVADVTSVIGHLNGNTPSVFDEKAADLNNSGAIETEDVEALIVCVLNASAR